METPGNIQGPDVPLSHPEHAIVGVKPAHESYPRGHCLVSSFEYRSQRDTSGLLHGPLVPLPHPRQASSPVYSPATPINAARASVAIGATFFKLGATRFFDRGGEILYNGVYSER